MALAWFTAGAAGAALLDTEVRDAQGRAELLGRVVAGQQTLMLLVEPTGSEARAWLVRTLANATPEVQRGVVVVLASNRPLAQWPDLDLSQFPAVRVYMDASGQLARSGAVRVFPSILGLGSNGAVHSRLAGSMAVAANLNAFYGHVRAVAGR